MKKRPKIVIGIAPSLISLIAARIVARVFRAKLWIHIQDFEVEAAFATGLLKSNGIFGGSARTFETWSVRADQISTISPQMCKKLVDRGISPARVVEFRNWSNLEEVKPLAEQSLFRSLWKINRPHVALYSGNIANKQGIEIIVEAARQLRRREDLTFIICGNGPNRKRLMDAAQGLDNICFFDLQPTDMLPDLLGLASVHLLPQIAGAADLVLPSKLTNILASGRPVVATAEMGTGLAIEVEGCGLVTPPGDATKFATAIELLLDDKSLRENLGSAARTRAEKRWSKSSILNEFVDRLNRL